MYKYSYKYLYKYLCTFSYLYFLFPFYFTPSIYPLFIDPFYTSPFDILDPFTYKLYLHIIFTFSVYPFIISITYKFFIYVILISFMYTVLRVFWAAARLPQNFIFWGFWFFYLCISITYIYYL